MGFVTARVSDVADIREFECSLPDDAQVQALAQRVAELVHYPLCGCEGFPLHYGFVEKYGRALDPHYCLRDLRLRKPIELRIVPLFTAHATGSDPEPLKRRKHVRSFRAEILNQRVLVQDDGLDLSLDVRIDADVHRQIAEFAMQDRFNECAGLLLGDVGLEDKERVVHIRAIAPAPEAEATRSTVKMTLAAWDSALWVRDSDHSQMRTLGWFHTHPCTGLFVSDTDVFVHRHFFNHPDMVAYVLDPFTGRDGFFYWHNNILALRPNYGLVCTAGRTGLRQRLTPGPKLVRAGAVALVVGGLLYLGAAISGNKTQQAAKPPQVSRRQSPVPAAKSPQTDRIYVVRPGDNLWIICNRHYGDGGLAQSLARYNGIRSTVGIQVGQRIKLPSRESLKRASR